MRGARHLGPAFLAAAAIAVMPSAAVAAQIIQPGAESFHDGSQCTLNFIFNGSDGYTYAGTAGHCYNETSALPRTASPASVKRPQIPTAP